MTNGDFCLIFLLVSKLDALLWSLASVYAKAQDAQKHEFVAELVRTYQHESLSIIAGGDFNIMRRKEDESK